MKTLKKSLIALMTMVVLFACNEDPLPTPAGSATNDLEVISNNDGGVSNGDQTSVFDIDDSSDSSGEESNDSKDDQKFNLGQQ